MARHGYTVGAPGAKVTADAQEAARVVAEGLPVVLVGADGRALGQALLTSPDRTGRSALLGVMVGDEADAAVGAAAAEMAAELWPWTTIGSPPSGR